MGPLLEEISLQNNVCIYTSNWPRAYLYIKVTSKPELINTESLLLGTFLQASGRMACDDQYVNNVSSLLLFKELIKYC